MPIIELDDIVNHLLVLEVELEGLHGLEGRPLSPLFGDSPELNSDARCPDALVPDTEELTAFISTGLNHHGLDELHSSSRTLLPRIMERPELVQLALSRGWLEHIWTKGGADHS